MKYYLKQAAFHDEMKKRLLTKADIAKRIGVAPSTLYSYTNNINKPVSMPFARKCIEYFGVDLGYLFDTDN